MSNIITVSREFGSGGRELGKRLADILGYDYYDREILEAIATKTDMNEGYVESLLQRDIMPAVPLHFGCSFSFYPPETKQTVNIMLEEQKVIKLLPTKGNCIIVGRGANMILKEMSPFNIFVYADMPSKIARCRERAPADEKLSDKELEKKIKQVDSLRAGGKQWPSGSKWGDKNGYHLCVNTSGIAIKAIAGSVAEYALKWFGQKR